MCNLSEAIEEEGIRKGKKIGRREGKREGKREGIDKTRVEAVETLMHNLNWSIEKALEALSISQKDYEKSLKNIRIKA